MSNTSRYIRFYTLLLGLFFAGINSSALALGKIFALPVSDSRTSYDEYRYQLLIAALDATLEEYGPYEVKSPKLPMLSDRILLELERGTIAVDVSPYKKKWEGKVLVVPFPTTKGTESYRLFFSLANKDKHYAGLNTLAQFKAYKFGQGRGWSTAKVLEDAGLQVVYADTYASLEDMLVAGRFDFYMRGPYRLAVERAFFGKTHPQMVVQDHFMFYTYLPYYYHVTKSRPDLAKRLEIGLKKLDAQGAVESLLRKHHSDALAVIASGPKKIFYLNNTNLKPGMYERDSPYLLDLVKIRQADKLVVKKTGQKNKIITQ